MLFSISCYFREGFDAVPNLFFFFFLDEQKYHSELYGLLYIIGAEDKENIFLLKRIRM